MSEIMQLDDTYIAHTYARFPVRLVEGEGSILWDESGRRYIDLGSGIAVNTFGIADKEWQKAVTAQLGRLKKNLVRALQEDVTDRQREFLLLYYAQGLNMRQIGERLGVDKSTVSRTIKRGEARLRRCLRYGAGNLLEEADGGQE